MAQPPVSREDAGVVVSRLAGDLSDALLALEQQFFLDLEGILIGGVASARKLVTAVDGDWAKAVGRVDIPQQMSEVQQLAMRDMMPVAAAFFTDAAELALKSIQIELRACELSTDIPSAHDDAIESVASRAVDRARLAMPFDMDVAHASFDQSVLTQMQWGRDTFTALFLRAMQEDEDQATVVKRMFSVDPVRLPGQSSIGVWWRALNYLRRDARGAEILMVNRLRKRSMVLFNRILAE